MAATLCVMAIAAGCGSTPPGRGGDVIQPQEPSVTCAYAGQTYRSGDSFPATDGCNTCMCGEKGEVGCTKIFCGAFNCSYGGQSYAIGARFPSTDGCNECQCLEGGSVACTERACLDSPIQAP